MAAVSVAFDAQTPGGAAIADAADGVPLFVNKRELARQVLHCSLPTLNDLLERYPDFPIERKGSNGVEWQFDPAKAVAFLKGVEEAERRASDERAELFKQFSLPVDEIAGDEARGLSPTQRYQLAKARGAETELARKSGFLLETAETRQALQTALGRLGKSLDALPGQIGRSHNLPDEVVRAIRNRIDEFRQTLVGDLKAFLTQE